jgi:hypothetical protein
MSKQRNDGQNPLSLPHAKACSNYQNPHGTLIYSTQFLHREIMSIFTKQYQHITELPSLVQGDVTAADARRPLSPALPREWGGSRHHQSRYLCLLLCRPPHSGLYQSALSSTHPPPPLALSPSGSMSKGRPFFLACFRQKAESKDSPLRLPCRRSGHAFTSSG